METSYTKIYVAVFIIFISVIAATILAGMYIEESQKSQWALMPEIDHTHKKEFSPSVTNQIIELKDKIIKLDIMARQSPDKISIIEEQKKVIRAHIKALENSN